MRVLFAAGGTGGHINPALAAAQELKSRSPESEILFVGTKDRMEAGLVPKAGFEFASISISGFQRSFAPRDFVHNLRTLRQLIFVSGQCKKIIEDFKPQLVVGFGGYVSGPVVRTAHKMGIKTAIHEQNAFPGKTNIILSKYADKVMLTSGEAEKYLKCREKPLITGLPVREEILTADKMLSRKRLGIPDDKKLILSTGGSLGAEAINNVICEIIPEFLNSGIIFVHGYGQLGKWVPQRLKEKNIDIDKQADLHVSEYIYNIAEYMSAADLVISRAGASSLAEIQALGKAALLVPSPYVSENHQYHNAMALVNENAAMVIEQKNLNSESVHEIIEQLLQTPEKFEIIGRNARAMAICDAKKKICDILVSMIQN